LYVLLASLLWASTPAVVKLLLADLNVLQILFFNNLFALIGLAVVTFIQGKLTLIRGYSRNDYVVFAWMGFLGVFLYTLFLSGAISLLRAQEAYIINYLWPVMILIFASVILKEKITKRKIVSIICSFVGVSIVITGGDLLNLKFGNFYGILLAVFGAVTYGLFSVTGKKQDYEKYTSMTIYYIFGFVYAVVSVLFFSEIPKISIYQLAGLFWLGFFTSGLAFVFWFLALKHGDTAKMSSMIFLTPFLSLIYIYFMIGEKILFSSIAGLVIIVVGILIQSKSPNPRSF